MGIFSVSGICKGVKFPKIFAIKRIYSLRRKIGIQKKYNKNGDKNNQKKIYSVLKIRKIPIIPPIRIFANTHKMLISPKWKISIPRLPSVADRETLIQVFIIEILQNFCKNFSIGVLKSKIPSVAAKDKPKLAS